MKSAIFFRYTLTIFFLMCMVSCVSKKKYTEAINQRDTYKTGQSNAEEAIKILKRKMNTLKNDSILKVDLIRKLNSSLETCKNSTKRTLGNKDKQLEAKKQELSELRREHERIKNRFQSIEDKLEQEKKVLEERLTVLEEGGSASLELKEAYTKKNDREMQLMESLQNALESFSADDLQIEKTKLGIAIYLSDKLLFGTGSTMIGERGKMALTKIMTAINLDQSLDLLIEGHTDNLPVSNAKFTDNWDASASRATAVARFLQEKGLEPSRLIPSGRSSFAPIADNNSLDGRSKNRRTQIMLVADLANFMDILERHYQPENGE